MRSTPQLPIALGILHLLARSIRAIPIPNAQVGDAEVECQEDTIEIFFYTEDDFRGRIFVVGKADNPKCVSRKVGDRQTSILIYKEECGAITTRSTDPPGLLVSIKVMLSFHDQFVTKVDRGYDVSCFYMAAEKTVTYPLSVSMNASFFTHPVILIPLSPFTAAANMPRCRYEVVDPSTKRPIEVATVGHQLLHTWTCESESPQLWCMRVHSCLVQDDSGTEISILDDSGCAIDRYLLDNLEYGPGDLQAQKEAHAFKFADKVVVNFQCAVRLDIRDGECPVPICEDLGLKERRKLTKKSKRHLSFEAFYNSSPETFYNSSNLLDVDVRAQSLQILDAVTALEHLSVTGSIDRFHLPYPRAVSSQSSIYESISYQMTSTASLTAIITFQIIVIACLLYTKKRNLPKV